MSDWTPTTEDVREDYRGARIMGDRDPDAEFDRWLANIQTRALYDAADEAEQIILSGDIAEVAAYVPGESGRQPAIEQRDALREDPVAWLRQHAQNVEDRQETDLMRNDDVIEQATRVLSRAWENMSTNESLGRQRMLACALADAGLLARPLPTREEIADAILAESLFGSRTPIAAADAVLALLKGQDK